VPAGVQGELLERAVELIDVTDEVAVDVDLRGARLDPQLQAALFAAAVGRGVAAAVTVAAAVIGRAADDDSGATEAPAAVMGATTVPTASPKYGAHPNPE